MSATALEIASRVAALVPGRGHLAGHLMAVTDLSLGQFSGLDRLGGSHSPASGSGMSAPGRVTSDVNSPNTRRITSDLARSLPCGIILTAPSALG